VGGSGVSVAEMVGMLVSWDDKAEAVCVDARAAAEGVCTQACGVGALRLQARLESTINKIMVRDLVFACIYL